MPIKHIRIELTDTEKQDIQDLAKAISGIKQYVDDLQDSGSRDSGEVRAKLMSIFNDIGKLGVKKNKVGELVTKIEEIDSSLA
ncbi:MAG: hypothetical protein GWN01_01430 [Nitrosopumilaceae archaeon]|nr:hypothetical protein [Nitrosopumilaceae archaeon]NIU86020.1 hypothetical protein [Nitrosopumilaceae archaeon]NIX60239.1 hypothetical protein [Nitrosopumilaceae archaeon]